MKLIIDLDEKIYNNINWFIDVQTNDTSNIAMVIKNGTPLNEVIEDIKQEIIDNSIIETTENGLKKISYVSVDYVLSVIDKHISRKDNE